MAAISPVLSESLSEYLILTGWVKARSEDVSLKANLGSIELQYPFMTSRMQCVVGPRMAEAGRLGFLTMVPRSLRDEDKQAILDANGKARLRKDDIELQENPECASPDMTLEQVVRKIERTGHSVIPVIDRMSRLYGVYIHNPNAPPALPPHTPVSRVMASLRAKLADGVPFLVGSERVEDIKGILAKEERRFLPLVDKSMILQKLAFRQKYDTNFIGIAVSTRGDWKREVAYWGARVDTLCIDSSNACFDDAIKVMKYAKQAFPHKPFGIGNIIQAKHFKIFAAEGADYIIGGMGVGSICRTGSERGNGRGQMTVAVELARARDQFARKRYVYLVLDGSMSNVKDMTVALAFADFIMMGNYFNRFYEAAAQKLDADKLPVSEEALMRFVETWGEGHPKARLVAMYGLNYRQALMQPNVQGAGSVIERYGHTAVSSATVEGVAGTVPYRGRIKPCLEHDARYIRTTMANAGAHDLKSFRKLAVLERASQRTLRDMLPHDIDVSKE